MTLMRYKTLLLIAVAMIAVSSLVGAKESVLPISDHGCVEPSAA